MYIVYKGKQMQIIQEKGNRKTQFVLNIFEELNVNIKLYVLSASENEKLLLYFKKTILKIYKNC